MSEAMSKKEEKEFVEDATVIYNLAPFYNEKLRDFKKIILGDQISNLKIDSINSSQLSYVFAIFFLSIYKIMSIEICSCWFFL